MLAYPSQTAPVAPEEEGIDVFSLLLPVARRWRLIAGLGLGLALLTVLGSFLLTTKYSAHATFLLDSPEASNNAGSGTNIIFGRQADPTLSLLFSNTVTDEVVRRSGVLTRETQPKRKDPVFLRNEVRGELNAVKTPDGVFVVTVTDRDPQRAIELANTYLAALQWINDKMNYEAAAHSREFYEAQVQTERALLEKAEADLASAQGRTGLVQPQNQTGIALGTIAALKSQITGLEVQLASTLQGATEQNPAVVRLRTEIAALRSREGALQGTIQSQTRTGVPTQNLELDRLQRNVGYHEGLVSSLGAQYERARIQESYTSGRVRVIDRATWPTQKTLPNRLLLALAGGVAGLLTGLVFVAIAHWRTRLMADPQNRGRVAELQHALGRRRNG